MIQYIKFGHNPSFCSRDMVQTNFFGQNLTFKMLVWPWKWGQGHQNLIISFLCLSGVVKIHQLIQEIECRSLVKLCKFGQNPPTGSSVDNEQCGCRCKRWWDLHQKQYVPPPPHFGWGEDIIHMIRQKISKSWTPFLQKLFKKLFLPVLIHTKQYKPGLFPNHYL